MHALECIHRARRWRHGLGLVERRCTRCMRRCVSLCSQVRWFKQMRRR
jgi:hypothetical protein